MIDRPSPQTFVEHFSKIHKKNGTGILIIEVGYIGPGRDDRAELTRADLTQADLTQGRLDPHSKRELVALLSLSSRCLVIVV